MRPRVVQRCSGQFAGLQEVRDECGDRGALRAHECDVREETVSP